VLVGIGIRDDDVDGRGVAMRRPTDWTRSCKAECTVAVVAEEGEGLVALSVERFCRTAQSKRSLSTASCLKHSSRNWGEMEEKKGV